MSDEEGLCLSDDDGVCVPEDEPLPLFRPPASVRRAIQQREKRVAAPIVVEDEPETPVAAFVPRDKSLPRILPPSFFQPRTFVKTAKRQKAGKRAQEPESLAVSNMLKRVAVEARDEARKRAQDADQVTTMARSLFFERVVDTPDLMQEYNEGTSTLNEKTIREILDGR